MAQEIPDRTSVDLRPFAERMIALKESNPMWSSLSAAKKAEFLLGLGLDLYEVAGKINTTPHELLKRIEGQPHDNQ